MSKPIKEVDDLDLVKCPACMNVRGLKEQCEHCHATGEVVTRRTKYYTLPAKGDRR